MTKQKRTNGTTKGVNKTTSLKPRDIEDFTERLAATPFTLMRRFSEEMDRLFGDFAHGRELLAPVLGNAKLPGLWSPQVEVIERDNELVVRADLPGLTKDEVDVQLSADGITIEGERKKEHKEEGDGYYRSERSYGKFYRRIPVPDGVNVEDAEATFHNGVLEITMPAPKRQERSKPRRLEIGGERHQKARGKAA